MSFFSSLGGAKGVQAKKQEIRQVQRIVTKPKPLPLPATATKPARPSPATNSSRSTPRTTGSNSARSSPATSTSTTKRKAQTQDPDRASAIRRNNKRKLATPPGTPLFGSSSESESEAEDVLSLSNVKRIKSRDKVVDLNPRKLRDVLQWEAKETAQDEAQHHLVHSADLTTGNHAIKHTPLFGRSEEDISMAELYYPGSSQPERFALVAPRDQTNHNPAGDLIDAIEIVLKHFFTKETSSSLLNESTGIPYLMRRAHRTGELDSFQEALSTFNTLITTCLLYTSPSPRD